MDDQLTPHPYAACYPLVSGSLEISLYESIRDHGLRQPLVLWRDEARQKTWIIDGRNRYRALCQLYGGVAEDQVIWREYQDDEEVRLAVLDYNENRRQMSTAQKSVVAGRILEARAELLSSSEVSPEVRREVADTLGIGSQTAMKGASVVQRGVGHLVTALEGGEVSVEAAYTLTQLDDSALEEVVAQGRKAMRERARELKDQARATRDEARDQRHREPLVDAMTLTWAERVESNESGEGAREQRYTLEILDPEHQRAFLKLIKKYRLRERSGDEIT